MGTRQLDKLILDQIVDSEADVVTFVGHGHRAWLIRQCQAMCIGLTLYDYDPKFGNPVDAIFDNVEFDDLVVVFNAEKHYPLGKLISREMIVVGDNMQRNGDCNPVSSCQQLIEQNNLTGVTYQKEFDKWCIVKGKSRAN